MRDEIGYCICILHHQDVILGNDGKQKFIHSKLWGKTLFEGNLRSEKWWQTRLERLREEQLKTLPITLTLSPEKELNDMPVPFEVEFDLSDNRTDCVAYFSWLERKKSFDKI